MTLSTNTHTRGARAVFARMPTTPATSTGHFATSSAYGMEARNSRVGVRVSRMTHRIE